MEVERDLLKDVDGLHDDLHDDDCNATSSEISGGEDEIVVDECIRLDCYPYSFSPLLLFAPGGYFDKGYSNYNDQFDELYLQPCATPVVFSVYELEISILENRKSS